jgi:hypothetical protein
VTPENSTLVGACLMLVNAGIAAALLRRGQRASFDLTLRLNVFVAAVGIGATMVLLLFGLARLIRLGGL